MSELLRIENICKSFPGVKVFDGFDFDLMSGEIHCVCGENGAGKSTMIKILSGAYKPDSGTYYFEGKDVGALTPHSAIELGIQTIYQEHNLCPQLSVAENLFIGKEVLKGGFLIDRASMVSRAKEVLEYLNTSISPYDIVGSLGSGAQKTVEIARGLVQQSKVMILDEPTASFNREESNHLLEIVRTLREAGLGIIYISHHLEEVFQIADRVTVIRDGEKINTHPIEGLTEEKLIKEMIGRDVSMLFDRETFEIGEEKFRVENVSGNGVNDISLHVRKGELLGVAGMVGSGRTELLELLFGSAHMSSGECFIDGEKVKINSPKQAIANHICFITESRQRTGLFLDHTVVANCVVASFSKGRKALAMPAEEVKIAEEYIDRLSIKTPSALQKAVFLSGGNQQKVVLAKWFITNGEIFFFDEPSRGIDIGAKEEIYVLMSNLLREGKSIVMVSSDMPELISMSDRIMVMRGGRFVGELSKEEISEENILKHSIGGVK
ncbi:MAG: sugar ABC transporter ATP-binding protein [Oscillospiraceae bacterium]|nr:sugar ABC transporter ATP-binding protein [Oscillospiraceae bacterium]